MDLDLGTLVSQGPWAVLSVFLLLKVFKRHETQLSKYEGIIKGNHETICKHQEINNLTLEVIKQNQEVISALTEKYDDLKASVADLNLDIREVYRAVCTREDS